jgi:hypothetical protein
MATKKPLKGAKLAAKSSKTAKTVAAKKIAAPKKVASAKGKTVVPSKGALQNKAVSKNTKSDKAPVQKAASAKLTKPSTVLSTIKKVANTVVKKFKEPVKKTEIEDKNQSKVAVSKKEATTEKKVKADVPVEKEAKTSKAGIAKAAKLNGESEKPKPVVIPKLLLTKRLITSLTL